MNLTRKQKIILGVLTLWPPLYILIFIANVVGMIVASSSNTNVTISIMSVAWIFPLHFLTIILVLALMVFYILYIVRSDTIPEEHRIVWLIAVIIVSIPAMIIFWFMHFWKELREERYDEEF